MAILEQVRGGEGLEQMEAGDGAAGAMGVAFLVGKHKRGATGALDDAGGENAEDAAMPVGMVEDEALGGEATVGIGEGK